MNGPLRPAASCLVAALALGFGALGCGHPATDAECREILDRIVELELAAQHVTDSAEVAKRRQELEQSIASGASGAFEGCLGKRITDTQLQCVRTASSVEHITGECLR